MARLNRVRTSDGNAQQRTGKKPELFPALVLGFVFLFFWQNIAEVTQLGQVGLVRSYSAQTLGKGRLVVHFGAEYSGSSDYVVAQVDPHTGRTVGGASAILGSGYLGLSLGLTSFWDLSCTVPVYADQLKSGSLETKTDASVGDVVTSMKFQYPPYKHSHIFDVAYFGHITIPTGQSNIGLFPRHSYYIPRRDTSKATLSMYTSERPEIDMKMLWTVDFGEIKWRRQDRTQIQLHINYGAHFTTNTSLEHAFLLNTALQYEPVPFLSVFTEFTGETRLSNMSRGFKLGDDPLRLTPGFSFNMPSGLTVKLSFDKMLSTDTTVYLHQRDREYYARLIPDYNVNGSLEWGGFLQQRDQDKDGIKDQFDQCPKDAEDKDGFEDWDGCPDNDNDKDEISDAKDRCPLEAEDRDGFEDADGCPEPDNDLDSILDLQDECPDTAEDRDGFGDTDGCPDLDNDKDNVPDSTDPCPDDPKDECIDYDKDDDNIPDSLDKCPQKPETVNKFEDKDGCPDEKPKVKEIRKGRIVLKGVNFKTGSADLTYDAKMILDKVAASLQAYPEVRVEVRGYTDNVGSRSFNVKLSELRATAVKTYLMNKKIDSSRMIAIGYGPANPIASNKTSKGRAKNRRIEFFRID